MTRADLKHCWKIPDAREELNRSVREGRIESRHSIKSLEGMGSSCIDFGAELRMHSFTVNCDTFSNEEKVAAVIQCNQKCERCHSNARIRTIHSSPECVQAFLCKNSLCCGVMHQVKKLFFNVFCFVREVVNSKVERVPHELDCWVVVLEVRKIALKLVQQPVGVDDGFVLEKVADATSSLADSRQRRKSRCTAAIN